MKTILHNSRFYLIGLSVVIVWIIFNHPSFCYAAYDSDYIMEDGVLLKFLGNDTIVTIPGNVRQIGDYAFENCRNIREVIIPDSVKQIGTGAFKGCAGLVKIQIPDSVTELADQVFSDCISLNDVLLSGRMIRIGAAAFSNCSSLESIQIPYGVESIGERAFLECRKLIHIAIPESVKKFGLDAFHQTGWLEDFPQEYVIVNQSLIKYKGSDREAVIPESVTSLEDGAFENCSFLQKVIFNRNLTNIGYASFRGCTSLTELDIPDGVTSIGAEAFYNCTGLEYIKIPESVIDIYPDFLKGTKLYQQFKGEFLEFNGILVEYLGNDSVVRIPDHITKIGSYVFYEQDFLKELIIPESVTCLSDRMAYQCGNLKKVSIPGSVANEMAAPFYNCNEDLVIYGIKGSVTESYAKREGISFIGISINKSNVTLYVEGAPSKTDLVITGTKKTIRWKSMNPEIAGITGKGKVTALRVGETVIMADIDGLTVSCRVSVKEPYINIKVLSMKKGQTYTVSVKGITSGIIWTSSHPSVASVNTTGRVTAYKQGTAVITAKVNQKVYTCKITVN